MLSRNSLGLSLGLLFLCTLLQAQSLSVVQDLLDKGQFVQAQKELEQLLVKSPDNLEAQLLLGQAHYGQSNFDPAIKTLKPLRSSMKTRASLFFCQLGRVRAR